MTTLDTEAATPRRIRSALFVDFDNIYLGLEEMHGPLAARRFADAPERWMRWMGRDMGLGDQEGVRPQRDILVRRCYLNPIAFGNQRAMFTTSAFQVVDCPPLTRGGKCSTDIHMVMDILDALHHPTHFDEFIILSADADFTPLLLRLRAYDRRTVVLAVGPAAEAYRRACDHLIRDDLFVERALGVHESARQPRGAQRGPENELLQYAAEVLASHVRSSGSMPITQVHQFLRERFPDSFPNSSWFGCNGFAPLLEQVLALQPGLARLGNPAQLVWQSIPAPTVAPVPVSGPELEPIRDVVSRFIADADEPVALASLAQHVVAMLGEGVRRSGWMGTGTFKNLIRRMELPCIEIADSGPGFVFDPSRHAPPAADGRPTSRSVLNHPDITGTAQRVHQVAMTPRLPRQTYALLFTIIADQFREEFTAHRAPLLTSDVSKVIRDACDEVGTPVSRKDINFVLRGIAYFLRTHSQDEIAALFQNASTPALAIAEVFCANVVWTCRDRQLELTADELAELRNWLLGGLQSPEQPPQESPDRVQTADAD